MRLTLSRRSRRRPLAALFVLLLAGGLAAACAYEKPPMGANCAHPNGPGTQPVCN
jgi:hypothetical protein